MQHSCWKSYMILTCSFFRFCSVFSAVHFPLRPLQSDQCNLWKRRCFCYKVEYTLLFFVFLVHFCISITKLSFFLFCSFILFWILVWTIYLASRFETIATSEVSLLRMPGKLWSIKCIHKNFVYFDNVWNNIYVQNDSLLW